MAKKKKKKSNRNRNKIPSAEARKIQEAAESRTAVAANVGWMLSLMATLIAEAIGLVCRWHTVFAEPIPMISLLSGVMLFVALISGLVTLVMIPVVLKVNSQRPPSALIQISIFAALLPMVVILFQQFGE